MPVAFIDWAHLYMTKYLSFDMTNPYKISFVKGVSIIVLLIIVLLVILFFTGCSASYRQAQDIKKLDALSVQQQPEFKRLANLLDPCFTVKGKSDTVIKQGKRDTIITPGSIVITRIKDTVVKTVTLPGRQVTIPTFTTITDTIPDNRALTAQIALFKVKADSLIIERTLRMKVSTENTHKLYWIIGLALGWLITIALVIYFKL